MSLYVVTGTDTGVGKTFVTTRLIAALRSRGVDAIGLKPVETGWDEPASDAALLAQASGRDIRSTVFEHYALPAAPSVAARAEGRTVDTDGIIDWVRRSRAAVTFVEGAGGWLVPFTERRLFRDLTLALAPDGVILVAGVQLGTVNHTLLSLESIRAAGCRVHAVAVSVRGPSSPGALDEIRARAGCPVLELPAETDALAASLG